MKPKLLAAAVSIGVGSALIGIQAPETDKGQSPAPTGAGALVRPETSVSRESTTATSISYRTTAMASEAVALATAAQVANDRQTHPVAERIHGAQSTGSGAERARARMTGAVKAAYAAGSDEILELVIAYRNKAERAELERLKALGVEISTEYQALPVLALRAPPDLLLEVAKHGAIEVVDLDRELNATALNTFTATARVSGAVAGIMGREQQCQPRA